VRAGKLRLDLGALLTVICLWTLAAYSAERDVAKGKKLKLVWSDEFEGVKLDGRKWNLDGPYKVFAGWVVKNAVYLDGKGRLVIKAFEKDGRYCGGMVSSRGKFEYRYGYWVARCKLPKGTGQLPAFWIWSSALMPGATARKTGGLECGTEIDVMEWVGSQPNKVSHTLHWVVDGKPRKASKRVEVPGVGEGFHTFAVEWTPEEYIFYVDGNETWRTNKAVSRRKQFACLSNLVVSGWAGSIEESKLPDFFVVDYVRVYQLAK